MTDPVTDFFEASDGYQIHVARWRGAEPVRGELVILHGVQSHGDWYRGLGRRLSDRGYETIFPDRRGSGRNQVDRGHAHSAARLLDDISEYLVELRARQVSRPIALAGISWGGKLAVVTAARRPDLVDALALVCPGLHPRVDVGTRDRLAIAWAFFRSPRKHFPIPLADPALFTDSTDGQAFIAQDALGLRSATASLLVASKFIDRYVRSARRHVQQPAILMLAGRDRIVDNPRTLDYFQGIPSPDRTVMDYPEGHHTLEFDEDPSRYANDLADWLDLHLSPRT